LKNNRTSKLNKISMAVSYCYSRWNEALSFTAKTQTYNARIWKLHLLVIKWLHKHAHIIATMLPRGVFLQNHHALEMLSVLFHSIYNIFEAQQTHSDQDMPVSPIQIHQIADILLPSHHSLSQFYGVSKMEMYYQLH